MYLSYSLSTWMSLWALIGNEPKAYLGLVTKDESLLQNLYYNSDNRSVCMSSNSSEANGRISFIFGEKMHLIPGYHSIYISWPSSKSQGQHRGQFFRKKINTREISWKVKKNVENIDFTKFILNSWKTLKYLNREPLATIYRHAANNSFLTYIVPKLKHWNWH